MESATASKTNKKTKFLGKIKALPIRSAAFICAKVMVGARAQLPLSRMHRVLMGIYAPGSGVRTYTPHIQNVTSIKSE